MRLFETTITIPVEDWQGIDIVETYSDPDYRPHAIERAIKCSMPSIYRYYALGDVRIACSNRSVDKKSADIEVSMVTAKPLLDAEALTKICASARLQLAVSYGFDCIKDCSIIAAKDVFYCDYCCEVRHEAIDDYTKPCASCAMSEETNL